MLFNVADLQKVAEYSGVSVGSDCLGAITVRDN